MRADEGWEFVKVGGKYIVSELPYVYDITVLEDNSNDERYSFEVSSEKLGRSFTISHTKNIDGYYNGMIKIYPE